MYQANLRAKEIISKYLENFDEKNNYFYIQRFETHGK